MCIRDSGNGSARLALQGFVHGICAGQALDIGIAHGGDVVAHGDACFLCGRAIVNTGHLSVAGLVDAKFHADAQNLAALDVHQFGVGVGSVVAGVLIARTQQITGGQAVVQGGLIDGCLLYTSSSAALAVLPLTRQTIGRLTALSASLLPMTVRLPFLSSA